MRYGRILATLLGCAFIVLPAYGKPTPVTLIMSDIEALQVNERSDDELYLAVSVHHSNGDFESYTMPGKRQPNLGHYAARFPANPPRQPMLYWHAKALKGVKNIALWQGEIDDKHGAEVVVSLIEHDMPPWNLDDLIGSVKFTVGKRAGHMSAEWRLLSADAVSSKGKLNLGKRQSFTLKDGEGAYKLTLQLK